MSDIQGEFESKISLVSCKPQEGKTFICINNIKNDSSRTIHLVLTMNTIDSSAQFFGRIKREIHQKRIIVFNSKKESAEGCHHAKNVNGVMSCLIQEEIKVIVCCAHKNRFRDSIPELLERIVDSVRLSSRKFVVHIDEAHKYIPENRRSVELFNQSSVVKEIIGYSATPIGIWTQEKENPLFSKILIRDVDAELAQWQIVRAKNEYFGVNRCEFRVFEEIDHEELVSSTALDINIPTRILKLANMQNTKKSVWYEEKYDFDFGNELLLLSFIQLIVRQLGVPQDSFSYHFMPAYMRKVTHYKAADIIFEEYPNANVIIMNGEGILLFRRITGGGTYYKTGEKIKKSIIEEAQMLEPALKEEMMRKILEPSFIIHKLIEETPNYPTFVTGLTCVGMSVTFINEEIGNFDSITMDHQHFSNDKLYQLCRFLFNYSNWSPENKAKIKITKFFSLTKSVVDKCLEYEKYIEHLSSEFSGKVCSINEVLGLEPEEPTERELKTNSLKSIKLLNSDGKFMKKFKVYDGNDAQIWESVNQFYYSIRGKNLDGKSRPRNVDGFWECSTTSKVDRQTLAKLKELEGQSWWSTFQLLPDQLSYARVFVGYDNLDDSSEYTISVKYVQLEDNEANRTVLQKYGKKTKKSEVSDEDNV
jgi:hypothetical protein